MRGRRRRDRLTFRSSLPEDTLHGGARVTWFGRTGVLAEGQRGVIELTDTRIRLRTRDGVLSVSGEAMTLGELSADAAMIRARRIDTVAYLHP
ncbi:MAG: YabP/YqfC family sporulation protein [Clostridia bacterium]|nr:YabP/YqfC family sporulation protein [Clostridia bacterium]